MRVSGAHLDHVGVYICWGTDAGGPYCRGSYQGFHVKTYVSPTLEADPKAREYVEAKVEHALSNHRASS